METAEVQHLTQTHHTHQAVAEEQVEQEMLARVEVMLETAEQEEVFLQRMDLELTVEHSAAVAAEVHTKEDRADLAEDQELETELHKETQTEVTLQQ
jgi:cell division FtsZ-interacting protein ZapD